jgi:hypothetical protein
MPFDFSDFKQNNEETSLFTAVGFVTVQWGHCEQSLEVLVNILHNQYGGKHLQRRTKIPKPLSEKIAFVKECSTQLSSLSPFRSELNALVYSFDSIKQTRHDLIHGALTDEPVVDGVFNFIRLETHPDIHEIKNFQFDLKEFPLLATELLNLGNDVIKVTRLIFDAGKQEPTVKIF